MTRKELEDVLKVLGRIKQRDPHVLKAVFIINKNIQEFNARKGQLKEQYDVDDVGPW